MKLFYIFFVFVFIVFAAFQYNDPDPYLWIPLYLYAALLCWLAAKGKFYPKAYWLAFAVCAPYAVYKVFDKNGLGDWITKHQTQNIAETMKAATPWIEESREFFGLVIIIIVLAINYFYSSKYQKAIKKN